MEERSGEGWRGREEGGREGDTRKVGGTERKEIEVRREEER